jgi:hypothetical protein
MRSRSVPIRPTLCKEGGLTHAVQGLETEEANEKNVDSFKAELKKKYKEKENEPYINAKCEKKGSGRDRVPTGNSPADIEWYVNILSVIIHFPAP